MRILQHYYTSFVNPETGSAGFQVKAVSPGISPEVQTIISRLIAYRIPSTLDERTIQQHPVALRYYYKSPQECILLCSQSNGSDENGRPGNFFAHTLVLEPEIFTTTPPIFYWGSSFWVKKDKEVRPQMSVLPELRSFEEEPSLEIERVWNFLAAAKRKEQFRKLMSAVVHCNKTLRRIVIVDTAEHVTLWIAAVSCMLPPDYRPLLSFATYHHDPYQGQFMITGTTSDSSFRNSTEEYITYFVLNTETDEISEVEDSPYANLVATCITADLYEARVWPLFALAKRRFPHPTVIDKQLDRLAQYSTLVEEQHERALTPDEMRAIDLVLTRFEQLPTYEEEDIADLKRLWPILEQAFRLQASDNEGLRDQVSNNYNRVVALLKKHNVTTAESLLGTLQRFTGSLFEGKTQAGSRIEELRQAHANQAFQATLERTEYLEFLNRGAKKASAEGLQLTWLHLGRSLKPDPRVREFLLTSLQVLDDLWNNKQNAKANALFSAMKQAIQGQEEAWLTLAVNSDISSVDQALRRFYCKLVQPLKLNARLPYRAIVQRAYGNKIIFAEVNYDVTKAGIQDGLNIVINWVKHARLQKIEPISEVSSCGLYRLQKLCNPEQWQTLAPSILENKDLAPLPPEWEDNLVEVATTGLSLSRFSPADIEFYRKYQDRDGLSDQRKTVMAGIVAMSTGQLDAALAGRLHRYFKAITAMDTYYAEVDAFISEFFRARVTADAHRLVINALFRWKFPSSFWQAYEAMFVTRLTQSLSAEGVIDLLSYWFALSPRELDSVYVMQTFFLRLPDLLEEARRKGDRGFAHVMRDFNERAAAQDWYPSIQGLFSERRGMFAVIGQNLGQLPKLFGGQNVDKEVRTREAKEREERLRLFGLKVGELFEEPIRESHRQNIPVLYTAEGREQFWSNYWEHFKTQLVSRQARLVLDAFTFWFDEAFDALKQTPYAAYEFFLGCSETFDAVRKEKGFRETAREVQFVLRSAYQKKDENYSYYQVVLPFFSV